MKDQKLWEKIAETLRADGPQKVVVTGETGIGKTWLAKMVEEHATKKGLCYLTLWLHLSNKFDDEWSLYKNIAFQIGVDEDVIDDKGERILADRLKNLKENIREELQMKTREAGRDVKTMVGGKGKELADGKKKGASSATTPYLLLILDDEGNKTSEDMVMKKLEFETFLKDYTPRKVLITRRKRYENTKHHDEEMDDSRMAMSGLKLVSSVALNPYDEIEFHTTDESQALLDTLTADNVHGICHTLINDNVKDLLGSLEKAWKIDQTLMSQVVRKSFNLPAAVVVLAKSLNCITNQKNYKGLSPKQEKVLKEVLSPFEPTYADSGYNPVLHLAYKLLETDDALENTVVDCFRHSLDIFQYCGCVDYSDLITQWILEGYFDPVRSVKKAYKDGHNILVELINRGILKTQEDDMVIPEMAMSKLTDFRHHAHLSKSRVRFARAYDGDKNKGLGRITQIDDMIKTEKTKNEEGISTILVSGNRLRRERPENFFQHMGDLEVLVLFAPTVDPLIPSLENLQKLRVLVIRDCDLLSDIEELKSLLKLRVFEVSGASSLKHISDDFFLGMPKLQSLNLSELNIISSPSSISKLEQLHSLTLRDCHVLEDLPDMHSLNKLEVVDIRGAHKLKTLPNIEGLTSLEVFNISGCTKLHKIEGCLKDMSYLREVNLSGTRIETLPELPEKSSICCSKVFVLRDSRRLIHDTWSQIKEAIKNAMSESLSSSDTVYGIQDTSRKESGRSDELWAFDCPEKKGCRREHLYQGHLYRDVYMKTIPFVNTKSHQEVLQIQGSNGIDQDKEILAKAELVVFVDTGAASLPSIFNDLKSVKACWLEMCRDIENLFSGVDKEHLRNLETLSVTNLQRLENMCSSSFKNLKELNLDCCPSIITLFPASAPPTSLEVLKIKFCEKLQKIFEEDVEVPNLHTLSLFELPVLSAINATLPNLVTYKEGKCPKLNVISITPEQEWIMVVDQ